MTQKYCLEVCRLYNTCYHLFYHILGENDHYAQKRTEAQ